jgi:tRNA 2-thiouridine synthesizing protein C
VSKHLVFIIDKPLHGNVKAQEFLDSILMAAAFDQRVDVVFVGDGVFAMLDKQQPGNLGMKNLLPVFGALSLYGINGVTVEEEALKERGLLRYQLHSVSNVVPRQKIQQTMSASHHIFSF